MTRTFTFSTVSLRTSAVFASAQPPVSAFNAGTSWRAANDRVEARGRPAGDGQSNLVQSGIALCVVAIHGKP